MSQSSTVFDSRDFIGGDIADMNRFIDVLPIEDWNGQEVQTFSQKLSSNNPLLALGFYELEEWGVWSRTDSPILVLPFFISGEIELTITAMGYGLNIDREITVAIGDASTKIMLSPHLHETSIVLDITSPARKVEFGNILAQTIDDINDPRTMGIGISHLSIRELSQEKSTWDGTRIFVDLANDIEDHLKFVGFWEQEPWGIWSRQQECYVLLPSCIQGACEIEIFAQSFGKNNGKDICISVGDSQEQFVLRGEPQQYIFRFNPTQPSNRLTINGLAPESTPTDPRTLGIGIHRLQIRLPSDVEAISADAEDISSEETISPKIEREPKTKAEFKPKTYSVKKRDEVYSAIFSEESKNNQWRDVVSAFVWNFRDNKNAVLIIKSSSASAASFFSELMFLFYRIGEMECRIIAIHSHDTQCDVDTIISASHVYVHIDTSISAENGLRKIQDSNKISIVSSSESEKFFGNSTILIKPNRQPKKICGSLFGIEKELEYVLDWNQLVDALGTAHGLVRGRSK